MSDYLSVANNPVLYIVTIILLAIVFIQAFIYLKMAFSRAKEFDIPKEKLIKAAKTAAITTVIPSIATVIALITLTPVLGLAFSWARLSVIGSLAYELMAAEVGATAAGTALNSTSYGASAFLASVVAMTIGSAPTLFFTAIFYKKYKSEVSKGIEKKGDKVYVSLLMTALMIGLYAPFVMQPVLRNTMGRFLCAISFLLYRNLLLLTFQSV
ncbi:MAG: DUF5058 family protein [Tissierellales bacterium]|nr:DUF5058 family protein [Tissierellales bacterium]